MGSGGSKKINNEISEKTPKKQKPGNRRKSTGNSGHTNDDESENTPRQPPKGARKNHPHKTPTKSLTPRSDFVPYEPENLKLDGNFELEKGVDEETPITDVSYPAPRPGKVITDRSGFSTVDFDILQNNDPKLASGTFEEVATILSNSRETELLKVRALTTWMSCQKIRTRQYGNDVKQGMTLAYMKSIKELKGTFAGLLAHLCRSIDIPCVIVRGVYKSMCHHVGEDDIKESRCTWNAVHVDGNWQLVHPYLICTPLSNKSPVEGWKVIESSKEEPPQRNAAVLNSFFFAANPVEFIKLCLPDSGNAQWQLLNDKVKYSDFIKFPFLRPAFHDSGMHLKSDAKDVLLSEAGICTIKIQCQPSSVNDIVLMYDLSSLDKDFTVDPEWGNLVLCGRNEDTWNVQVKFPVDGTFKLSVFANLYDWFFWIGDFKIVCYVPCNNFVPMPSVPKEVGYGPSQLSEKAGLLCPSHEGGIIFYKIKEEHVIKFLNTERLLLKHDIENVEYDTEELHKYCKMIVRRNEIDFVVNLPLRGEFALRIYKLDDNMETTNVCNYLFTDADDGRGRENVFQRRARVCLREATAGHEIEPLEKSLEKYNSAKLEKDDDYQRAVRRLRYLQLKKGLRDGRMRRHEETLQKAVSEAESSPYRPALATTIDKANSMLAVLESLEMNCHPVQEMDHKTFAEIANFNKPPRDVHNTMIATYLLLGEDRQHLQKWGNIQALLRRQGKDNVKHRIKEFQNSPVPDQGIIQTVQKLHDSIPKPYIVAASLSAAAFYDWVNGALAYLHNTSQNATDAENSFDTDDMTYINDPHHHNHKYSNQNHHSNHKVPDDPGEISQDEGFLDSHEFDASTRANTHAS